MRFRACLVGMISLIALSGCPEDEKTGGTCQDYQAPEGFDGATPAVSFKTNVLPIFERSCAFSDCHNSLSRTGLSLGDQGRINATTAHTNLVGKAAAALPTMAYVTPGNPRESFLMHKLDGSACTLDVRCVDGNCGESMPRESELLAVDERDIFRRWILQGAKND